jgi:hypothetical protein
VLDLYAASSGARSEAAEARKPFCQSRATSRRRQGGLVLGKPFALDRLDALVRQLGEWHWGVRGLASSTPSSGNSQAIQHLLRVTHGLDVRVERCLEGE